MSMHAETGEVKLTSEIKPEEMNQYVPAPFLTGQQIKSRKVGRNETCPCGSEKKFKKCCLNTKLNNRGEAMQEAKPWVMAGEAPEEDNNEDKTTG